jgi:hypothetical protein
MMGRLKREQGQLFYSFCLNDAVPDDHPVREIAAVLELAWVYAELAPHYSEIGRPSIDPNVDRRLRFRDPLRACALPRGPGEPWHINGFVGLAFRTGYRITRHSRVRATNAFATKRHIAVTPSPGGQAD